MPTSQKTRFRVYLGVTSRASLLATTSRRSLRFLPGLGYVEGVTHDYRRHGTTTLFAALDTASGKVLT